MNVCVNDNYYIDNEYVAPPHMWIGRDGDRAEQDKEQDDIKREDEDSGSTTTRRSALPPGLLEMFRGLLEVRNTLTRSYNETEKILADNTTHQHTDTDDSGEEIEYDDVTETAMDPCDDNWTNDSHEHVKEGSPKSDYYASR